MSFIIINFYLRYSRSLLTVFISLSFPLFWVDTREIVYVHFSINFIYGMFSIGFLSTSLLL